MNRLTAWLSAAALLLGCAPQYQAGRSAEPLRAQSSPQGVVWSAGGAACVARTPSLERQCPSLPAPATLVSWNGGDAWAYLPELGVLLTLDGTPRTLVVGRATALSAQAIYREDGSALTYLGTPAAGVAGAPAAALTGADGQDYVRLAGRLRRVSDGAVIETSALPYLVAGAQGVYSASTVVADGGPLGRHVLGSSALRQAEWVGWAGPQLTVLRRSGPLARAQDYRVEQVR
ncbi:hypothetical protein ACFP81_05490 [Deinococcus lacus]|uniref:Lipoprotein n=1 Tax=Deinococcus lacus TaxID=392561 RepID=A0ABW1YDN0_9DEIO